MLMLNEHPLILWRGLKLALIVSLMWGTVLAQTTDPNEPHLATAVSLQFVKPTPPPNYDKEVLDPLHKAQAESAAREAQRRAEALAAAKAQAEQQQAIQNASNNWSVVSFGQCGAWMTAAGVTDPVNAYRLIMMESGCRTSALNPTSGACGIPQALPCSKLGTNDPVAQIVWMQNYVVLRYGSWANAVAFHLNTGWY